MFTAANIECNQNTINATTRSYKLALTIGWPTLNKQDEKPNEMFKSLSK